MPAPEVASEAKCAVCVAFDRIADPELRKQYPEAEAPGVLAELDKIRARHAKSCREVARVSA